MTMMDPPSSFIFENIPFHLKHHLLLKTKHFWFSKARLSIRKPFNQTGNQGRVNNSKEGNAAIGLTPNSYHLMHHSSDKEFKNHKEKVNAPGLALCCRGVGICSTNIEIKTIPDRWGFSWWCSLFFFNTYFFFVFYT
jgi:hypothetical protein